MKLIFITNKSVVDHDHYFNLYFPTYLNQIEMYYGRYNILHKLGKLK